MVCEMGDIQKDQNHPLKLRHIFALAQEVDANPFAALMHDEALVIARKGNQPPNVLQWLLVLKLYYDNFWF